MNIVIEYNKSIVRRFFDGTHRGDLSIIDTTVAPDVVTHGFPGGVNPYDHASYKAFFVGFGAAFADMEYDLHAVVAEGDKVAVRFSIHVTHTGPFAGIEPTGTRVAFNGIVLYRLRDGLIAETWLQIDEGAILAQLRGDTATAA